MSISSAAWRPSAREKATRSAALPDAVVAPLKQHLVQVKETHSQDLARGFGKVELPHAFARKSPHAARNWLWQYV
jgi:hypothetical protein